MRQEFPLNPIVATNDVALFRPARHNFLNRAGTMRSTPWGIPFSCLIQLASFQDSDEHLFFHQVQVTLALQEWLHLIPRFLPIQ